MAVSMADEPPRRPGHVSDLAPKTIGMRDDVILNESDVAAVLQAEEVRALGITGEYGNKDRLAAAAAHEHLLQEWQMTGDGGFILFQPAMLRHHYSNVPFSGRGCSLAMP